MTVLGTITLWLAPLLATWSIAMGLIGFRRGQSALLESSRRATLMQAAVLGITILALLAGLLRHDFAIRYVSDHSSRNLDPSLLVVALASGWDGMLLLSLLALVVGCLPELLGRDRSMDPRFPALASGVFLVASIAVGLAGPLGRVSITPMDGAGLDPRLQDATFLLRVPLACAGYTCAVMALIHGVLRGDRSRIARWLLGSAVFLVAAWGCVLWHAYATADLTGAADWTGLIPVASPLLAVLLPLAWLLRRIGAGGRTTGNSWPLGVVVAGLLALGVGLAGWDYGPERDIRMKAGTTGSVRTPTGAEYVMTHMGLSRFETSERTAVAATLDLDRNGSPVGLVSSERRVHFNLLGRPVGDPVTRVGVHRGLLEDVRVVFLESSTSEETRYRIRIAPLASLMWIGLALLFVGLAGLFLALPE